MDEKTVAEVDSEYFALIMAAHDAAYDKIGSPDFVRMLPPPDKKTPANLIYAWGIELFRLGYEAGFELAERLLNAEDKSNDD